MEEHSADGQLQQQQELLLLLLLLLQQHHLLLLALLFCISFELAVEAAAGVAAQFGREVRLEFPQLGLLFNIHKEAN